jgi:hypothetical protein
MCIDVAQLDQVYPINEQTAIVHGLCRWRNALCFFCSEKKERIIVSLIFFHKMMGMVRGMFVHTTHNLSLVTFVAIVNTLESLLQSFRLM